MKPTKKPKVKDSADIGADAEFDKRNAKFIRKMNSDKKLLQKSKNWVNHVFDYEYVYHFRWLGRPIIQLPQDMIAVQELIWKTKPDLIIESGIARGGSLIFYASITQSWNTIKIEYLNAIIFSGVIGIFLGDSFLFMALKRIGPRRNNILFSLWHFK